MAESAVNKVMNYMLPSLEGNQMANLLGVDTMRKSRGRGLLDAGLTAMALSGPRPAGDNVNTAMILKQMVDQGTKTYDASIDRKLQTYKTNLALQAQIDKKNSFSKLMESGLFEKDELEYAKILGATDGADFLSKIYMQKLKKVDQKPSVKKMVVMKADGTAEKEPDGSDKLAWVDVKDILAKPDMYKIPDEKGTFAKNIHDFEKILQRPLTLQEKQDYVLAKMNGQNISFTTDPDGTTTLRIGGSGTGDGMEKTTKKDLEKRIINAISNYDDFQQIKDLWRPEFNTIPLQIKVGWNKWRNKLGEWNIFGELSDEDKQLVRDFSLWEQKSWESANAYIKSITGAQMSEKEAERILKGFADPRLGKSDPVSYQAKLDGILKNAERSIIRYNLIMATGMDIPTDGQGHLRPEYIMSLGNVDNYVQQIGTELKNELMVSEEYNGWSDEEINAEVVKQLSYLLGLKTKNKNTFTLDDLR